MYLFVFSIKTYFQDHQFQVEDCPARYLQALPVIRKGFHAALHQNILKESESRRMFKISQDKKL